MKEMRFRISSTVLGIIVFFVLIAVVFTTMVGIDKILDNNAINEYNNGICRECGGHYEYLQAVGHYGETGYIYICNGCRRSLELPKYM